MSLFPVCAAFKANVELLSGCDAECLPHSHTLKRHMEKLPVDDLEKVKLKVVRHLLRTKRLYGMRCPIPPDEEIYAAGRNKAERMLGFPCDRTDIFYAEGSECYFGDVKNVDGRYHFRTVAMENIPHTTVRMMHVIAWSFLRRFARNLETGEVIELYE